MRVVETPAGRIEVTGLKRKELKGLEQYGYRRSRFTPPVEADPDEIDAAVDAVLEKQLKADDLKLLEDLEPKWTSAVWLAIIKETYGAPDEEKN